MEIKPLYDRVLLVPYHEQKSSLVISLNSKESNKMKVVALGDNTSKDIKINDIVLINAYSASQFQVENKEYYIIKECDILGILKEDK